MDSQITGKSYKILIINTIAFAVCFAAWMLNGVLVTFLVDAGLYSWSNLQMGILIATPILTGAVMRLPVGLLSDIYGGRIVIFLLMLIAAIPMFVLSYADSYVLFLLASLGFGLTGASFAAGIAYTSVWFPKSRVGMALGVFGVGNAGAALTTIFAPSLLEFFTATDIEGWRMLPKLYAGILIGMAIIFWFTTITKLPDQKVKKRFKDQLAPLAHLRVWRFGLYYSFFFGGFVALSQWLVPYYVNVYTMSIGMAGFLTSLFSLPSGIIRALGGWMSDRWGARAIMYGTLIPGFILCIFLFPAAMVIQTPGEGITAPQDDIISQVTPKKIVLESGIELNLEEKNPEKILDFTAERTLIFPTSTAWQEPVVEEGEEVHQGQLLAKGTTRIFFQANQWLFTFFVFLLGLVMGIGMAAVFKHIPTYFPSDVGVVGGLVGVLGGLGGFFFPIIFGLLLEWTGLWTTTWMFLALVAAVSLIWMHLVVKKMMNEQTQSGMMQKLEDFES
ncbi:MAG TPA: MFS transporter [Bacteroidales bacterium]|nr:MFS transporter [Bacteroidales bacterium]